MADRVAAIEVFDVINGWKQIQHVRASTWDAYNKMVARYSQPLSDYSERQKLKLGWHSRYAVHALSIDNDIIADNGGIDGAIRRFPEASRKKAGNRTRGEGFGGTQAEHEDETAGAFEQVELYTRRGQDALDNLRAEPSTATRRRALEALDMLSFWVGRAHQSQTHGNPLHKKGGANPVNVAVSLQTNLRNALAACVCSKRK